MLKSLKSNLEDYSLPVFCSFFIGHLDLLVHLTFFRVAKS
jgi:hypothetical protein